MTLTLYLVVWFLSAVHCGKIKINDPNDITGSNHIDFYIPSYPVALAGSAKILDSFDENLRSAMMGMIKSGAASLPFAEVRGIPPSNWVKFAGPAGEELAMFTYKSVHRCIQKELEGSQLVDSLDVVKLKEYFGGRSEFYMSRTAIAHREHLHTVTTEVAELYIVDRVYKSMTSLTGAHSDIRVIPFTTDKGCYYDRSPILKRARYVLTGATQRKDWTEQVFVAL
jgi:hypothetical protein